jgi:hypothetical protein
MNNKEVYINDQLVDLDEGKSPIRLTYAVNDLAELKDRQAYSTNSFKLPLTQNNLSICGFPLDAPIIGLQPYRKNTGKVVQGGVEILVNGIALITGASDSIQVQILSGLKGFFDTIADKKLSELDLSAYDHVWDLATVAGSQLNTDGFIYPVIDYGGLSVTDRRADVRQLRPATFRKTIIEQIAIDAGYSISGSYTAYQKYIDSLVPFTNDKFSHSKDYADNLATYNTSARKTIDQQITSGDRNQIIVFQDDATTDPSGAWSGSEFTAQVTGNYAVQLNYDLTMVRVVFGGSTPDLYVSIQKLIGGTWVDQAGNLTTCTNAIAVPQDFNGQSVSVNISLLAGEKLRVNSLQGPSNNRQFDTMKAGASISFNPIVEDVIYKSDVQLAATLPDVTQKNFFKDFLQQFGLTVIPDNYRKSLLLINMEDVYANKPNAEDITDKLFNSVDDVTFALDGYGINNYAKYKEDDNVLAGLGNGVMTLDNLTLNAEVTIIESIFAASQSVIKMGGVSVTEIKKIEDIAVNSDFKVKTQPRILLNGLLSTRFIFFDNVAFQEVFQISLPKFDGLSYVDLLSENYPEFQRMLYRPYIVEKQILLSEVDIANIDWRIPVYDKNTASYYYKNQITYQQGQVSTISLIRMV